MIRVCILFIATTAGMQTFRICNEFPAGSTDVDWFQWALGQLSWMQQSSVPAGGGQPQGQGWRGQLGSLIDYDTSIESVTPV